MNPILPSEIGAYEFVRTLPLRVNNVAKRLNVPERTVRHWALIGRLRAFKIDGKSWAFWPEDIADFSERFQQRCANA